MKQRIMSRQEIARIALANRNREEFDNEKMNIAASDMMIHLIADGLTVKTYNDIDMGGWVVDIAD